MKTTYKHEFVFNFKVRNKKLKSWGPTVECNFCLLFSELKIKRKAASDGASPCHIAPQSKSMSVPDEEELYDDAFTVEQAAANRNRVQEEPLEEEEVYDDVTGAENSGKG